MSLLKKYFITIFIVSLIMVSYCVSETKKDSSDRGYDPFSGPAPALGQPGSILNRPSSAIDSATVIKVSKWINEGVGFLSNVATIAGFIFAEVNAPTASVADIFNAVNSGFIGIKSQLQQLSATMAAVSLGAYQDVELAILTANNDFLFNRTGCNIPNKANVLSNRLIYFLNGMLGFNGVGADILKAVSTMYNCGSMDIYNASSSLISLVNIGAIGLGYYNATINNLSIFNGTYYAQKFNNLKSQVLTRVQNWQNNVCAGMNTTAVNNYITPILNNYQSVSDVVQVTKALYTRLDNIYYVRGNTMVYIANNYDASKGRLGYWGSGGVSGSVTNGSWTAFWVIDPYNAAADSLSMTVDSNALSQIMQSRANDSPFILGNPDFVYGVLKDQSVNWNGMNSVRKSVALGVFINPSASSGTGITLRRNAYFGNYVVMPGFTAVTIFHARPLQLQVVLF